MKTPVIIAAYNEAEYIGRTLARLDSATTEPFVVVNGEEGAQETVVAAEQFTDAVHLREEQGKLPAIQYALRTLLARDSGLIQRPIILTDADTYPLFPRAWSSTMAHSLEGETPAIASGLTVHHDGPLPDRLIRSFRKVRRERQIAATGEFTAVSGANMAINIGNDDVYEQLIGLPHIWPSEDRHMAYTIATSSDESRFVRHTGIKSAVGQSMRFSPSMWSRILNGQQETVSRIEDDYARRRAIGVTHYATTDNQLVPYDEAK